MQLQYTLMMMITDRLLHFSLKQNVSTVHHVGAGHFCLDKRQALIHHELPTHMIEPILVLHLLFYLDLVHLLYLLPQKRELA